MIRHIEGNRFPVGEIDGAKERARRDDVQVLSNAGFKAPVVRTSAPRSG